MSKAIIDGRYKDKSWLKRQIKEGKNTHDIARICNKNPATISSWIGKYNLFYPYAAPGRKPTHIKMTKNISYLINASLLGDGGVVLGGMNSGYLVFGYRNKEYAEYIREKYILLGVKMSKVKFARLKNKRSRREYIGYFLKSGSYEEFKNLYSKWYTYNTERKMFLKTVIPKNIELNRMSFLIWYLDDGSLTHSLQICLAVNCFSNESVDLLIKILRRWGINSEKRHYHNKGYEIYLDNINSGKFLKKIGSCPVNCYKYKWIWRKAVKFERRVRQFSLDGKLVDIFKSIVEAERHTKISAGNISKVCHNYKSYYTAGGYKWEFVK